MQPEVVTSNARSRMIEGKQWTMTILEIVNGKLVRAGRRRLTETFLSEKVFFEDFLCSIFSRCPAAYRFLDGSASAASHYRGGSGGGWGGGEGGGNASIQCTFFDWFRTEEKDRRGALRRACLMEFLPPFRFLFSSVCFPLRFFLSPSFRVPFFAILVLDTLKAIPFSIC